MGSCGKYCVFLLLLVLADCVPFTIGESTDDILQFLAQSEEKLILDPKEKEVVLVFGKTGAGKTTFTQWIAGDDSKLISVEQNPGNFIIVDNNNRIGNSTVQSKTSFPELVLDEKTGTAYYDFSGFGDTRGIKHDLATSYFIKRAIDQVDKVKILLVTDYEAVRVGGSRKDFFNLLQHIAELIKNTDRYLPGMGLVVTKVPNLYSKTKLVSDDTIVKGIVEFLNDLKAQTAQKIDFNDKVRGKVINLIINIISENNFKVHEANNIESSNKTMKRKIMLFRRPDDSGPLNSLPVFHKAKLRVETVISENLKFISKRNEDFSYTVSAETKYKLHNLTDVLKESLEENVKTIAHYLKQHFENKINIIEKNTRTIDIYDIEKAELELIKVQNYEEEVNDGIKNIFTLASDIKNTKRYKDIAVILQNTVNKLNVSLPQQTMLNILSEVNFLEFINEVSILTLTFDSILLQLPIQETANKLNISSIKVKQYVNRFAIPIKENIKISFKNALKHLTEYISKTGKNSLDFAEMKTQLHNFYSIFIELQETSNPKVKINKLNYIFNMSQTIISDYILQKLNDTYYNNFFIVELNVFVQSLNDLHTWYDFLDKLYNDLSSYNIQNNSAVQSICQSIVQSNTNYQERNVRDTNIEFFLRDCSKNLYDMEFNKIKNLTLTQYKVDLLTNVLDFTLNNNNLSYHCSDSKLVVKGHFVKMSDVNLSTCSGISILEIVGIEKVFLDKDIDYTGLDITMIIMAPHWVVLGNRKIILNGKPGKLIQPMKAKEGQDGRPGMPGGNAGNFLGYLDKIENSENLFISVNGGNGSLGQEGGDGKPGSDGDVPKILYSDFTYGLLVSQPQDNFEYWMVKGYKVSRTSQSICGFPLIYCRDIKVTGTSCSDGGDGGRGGAGGDGGAAGVVLVPHIRFSAKNGTDGAPGAHGRGGVGGRTTSIFVYEQRNWYVLVKYIYYIQKDIEYQQCNSGETPSGYHNSIGSYKSSPRSDVHDIINPSIDDFKAYLQQNLNKTFRKQYLLNIMNQVHF